MSNPLLEEIWRVRQELIKQHGGLARYVEYVRKLDRARRNAQKKRKKASTRRLTTR